MNDEICKGNKPSWIVVSVIANKNYTLTLTFITGEKKIYNALPLLEKQIYAPLKDLSFFLQAKVLGDSVAWNDEIDIAPEHLYKYSKSI